MVLWKDGAKYAKVHENEGERVRECTDGARMRV